ncbi:phosphoethanolamine transferase [Sulfurospirillum sp. 1307]|jgi:lipid A ethanolaminephosphotransferase
MRITQYNLIFLVSLFFLCFANFSFFENVLKVYPWNENAIYIISVALFLLAFFVLFFTLLSSKYTTKPILILTLLVSSFTSYFMDTYHVVIDSTMIRNSLQTDIHESLDLFSLKMVLYVLFLGILPSILVYKAKIKYHGFKSELWRKIKVIVFSIVLIVAVVASFSKFYTSFFREHKPLRYYTNPTYWIYSVGKYISKTYTGGPIVLKKIGLDAKIEDDSKRKLIIMVVGESARADRFSLNGYEKETNPLLKQENVVSFTNMYSCGTSTATSVPCMFSMYDRSDYSYKKGISTENAVDILKHTNKVDILWRDNNSDSKGVALRVNYEDYKTPNKNNPICDDKECRDMGMLVGLDKFIEKSNKKDIFIVLHQMGNHGPAYYKRYPKEFLKFKPICTTNQLEKCTQEEISNAYDNAILYTDYFLSKTIEFLKGYSKDFETAMIYMSDHGESLGENGVYLHAMPYFMAPDAQKHVASVFWSSNDSVINALKKVQDKEFSQDNLFDTILGIFDVKTKMYNKTKDIVYDAKNNK